MFTRSLSIAFLLVGSLLQADMPSPAAYEEPQDIIIYNRILAKVGSKTISVLDVVKKMDIFLTANYPQAMESRLLRYQFYSSNWRAVFEQMIDSELVLNDVGEKDLKITEGDVREAILQKFGPNVMATLDRCGLTYEEAKKITKDELILQRMTWFKVQSKSLQQVGPQDVRDEYKDYLTKHPSEETWTYQVISIRTPEAQMSEQIAREAYTLLHGAKSDFAALKNTLEERKKQNEAISFVISDELIATERSISQAHRKGLEGLKDGECSQPILQISGGGNEKNPVQRIFYLKQHGVKAAPAFQELKDKLQQKRIEEVMQREDLAYKNKLRQRYGHFLVQEELPSHFEPFSLEFATKQ